MLALKQQLLTPKGEAHPVRRNSRQYNNIERTEVPGVILLSEVLKSDEITPSMVS